MLFNSIAFAIFLPIVFFFYWIVFQHNLRWQNTLLLIASYVFYAWVNWKILSLLIVTTLVFYGLGLAIYNAAGTKKKNRLNTLGILFGLGVLLYFKYANFFITAFKDLFEQIGLQTNLHTFSIIVPIGISFYTFRLLSYLIDINRGKQEPAQDIVAFSAYVAFFPSILAGPIDRPQLLLPQLQTKRIFDYNLAIDGCKQILWGLFKKAVIADNCAVVTNFVFDNSANLSGSTLLLGAIFFSFQMYADFSGYSDMAIGIAKLLGFRITQNFNYPLFAQNIADFWRRWHISLTSWLTDYVFMPLNIKWRDWGKKGLLSAIMIDFIICGLWHGANWTFVLWGFYHGLLFIPIILSGKMFKKTKIETCKWGFPTLKTLCRMIFTFFLVTFGLIFFNSESISSAWTFVSGIFSSSLFIIPSRKVLSSLTLCVLICVFMFIEWSGRNNQYAIEFLGLRWKKFFRWAVYMFIIFSIFMFVKTKETPFIYFQF